MPQNATTTTTTTSTPKKTVFVNEHYQAPVVFTPTRVPSRKEISTATTSTPLPGGDLWLKMADCIRASPDRFLRETADTLDDIGMAWQQGDWEAVTYGAMEASQSMKLAAQSINKRHDTNELQQAYAGIAVQLLELSNSGQVRSLTLQGLALRLYQASRSTLNYDDIGRPMEQASREALVLAKLHGAKSYFLPRRFQLWWQDRKEQKEREKSNPKERNNSDTTNTTSSSWE